MLTIDHGLPTQSSVQVVIRMQPPQNPDIQLLSYNTLSCLSKQYCFDYIFPHDTTQQQIYEKIGMKMIASAKKGYNSCIFAYGQTGSGKTYTMTGTQNCNGLIQSCMKGLFNMLEGFQSFQLKVSYFQIYNQQVNDLLISNNKKNRQKTNIKIKQSLTLGFYLQNLQQIKIEGISDLIQYLDKGIKNRTTAQTKMNRESSRSHSILSLFINTRQKRQNGQGFSIKSSKMHFVDLAGSQKQKSTLAAGDRLKQASSINKSLTSLSIVIEKLSAKAIHIPYRDSVLTKILRDSLGGNSKTILIATISSKQQAMAQTISTLNFAMKAKKVKLSARVNQQYDGSLIQMRRHIKQLQQQIKQLKNKQNQNQNENKCTNCKILKQQYDNICIKIQKLQQQIKNKQNKIQEYKELLQKMQKQYEYQLVEYMHRVQQLQTMQHNTNNNNNKANFNFNFNQLSQQQNQSFQQRQNNNNKHFLPYACNGSLSIILEQNTQNQTSQLLNQKQILSEISKSEYEQNINKFRNYKAFNQSYHNNSQHPNNMMSNNKSNTLNSPSIQIAQLYLIKQLKQKNSILQAQLKFLIKQKQRQLLQNQLKQKQNKQIYQPIIRKWIQDNGSIIKNNMKARNAIEQDIILGMKDKIRKLQENIKENQDAWKEKQRQYKSLINRIITVGEQFQEQERKRRQCLLSENILLQANKRDSQGYLSKSHPRLSAKSKQIISPITIQQPTIHQTHPKQSIPNIQPQQYQKLLQQIDRQQLLNSQLQRQLQNSKYKCEQLQSQIQQNRQLTKYWQTKFNNLTKIKKEIQINYNNLAQQKQNLKQQMQTTKIKKQEDIVKLQNQLYNNQQKQLQRSRIQNNYKLYINKLQSQTTALTQQNKAYEKIITNYENKVKTLNNTIFNISQQCQNNKRMLQYWKNNYNNLIIIKTQLQQNYKNAQQQNQRIKQNNSYVNQQYNRKYKLKQKQLANLQKQNAKQYMQWLNSMNSCKLLSMKYNELKDNYQKLKLQKQQISLRNKSLVELIQQDQSQSFRNIHRLNQNNTQLQKTLQRNQQKLTYLTNQFANKSNQVAYWKQEYQKQRKWVQDFKKMQDQFIIYKERQRERQRTRSRDIDLNKIKQTDKKKKNQTQQKPQSSHHPLHINNTLNTWQYNQSKRQIQQIVNKLSQLCGIEINKNNLILQLDQIINKINQFKILKEDNKNLKAKYKLLSEQRNSDFWKKIQ